MKAKMSFFVLLLLGLALISGASFARAQDSIHLLRVISIPDFVDFSDPTNLHAASFDIGWTDRGKYYLADRGPTATAYGDCGGRVDVIDADDNLDFICGFVGNIGSGVSGPNGILVLHAHGQNELWAGDGDGTVKVVDLDTRAMDTIDVGACPPFPCGVKRADELAYDSKHHIIVVANDADAIPFLTFISQGTPHRVLGKLPFDGSASAPVATDGLEQPVFDKSTKKFYQAVPETPENPGGEIDVIDPVRMEVTNRFPLKDCVPHGLTVGPSNDNGGHNLLVGCNMRTTTSAVSIVMDDTNGDIVATITQVGGSDEVWFNKGDNRYYLAANNCPVTLCGGPVLGVIDAETNERIENVPTATGAHSVAVNPRNNHVFVPRGPVSGPGSDDPGVAVYGHVDD